tara:strand:- start:155 stop:412 length:258 start_codon:yes stop_codon:yes gene_type:complete
LFKNQSLKLINLTYRVRSQFSLASQCGYIYKENRESQSIFKCKSYNYCENADRNASYNILKRGNNLLLELGNQDQLKNAPVSAIA